MNPVAAIAHVIAIALGAFGGIWAIEAVTPELPDADVEAGVEVPVDIPGGHPDSLFNPGPLSTAFFQLDEQAAANVEYTRLAISPTSIETEPVGEFPGSFGLDEVSSAEPARVIAALSRERSAITADRVREMELIATEEGPQWLIQLVTDDPALSPPWQYVVGLGSDRVQAGGALPVPFGEG